MSGMGSGDSVLHRNDGLELDLLAFVLSSGADNLDVLKKVLLHGGRST